MPAFNKPMVLPFSRKSKRFARLRAIGHPARCVSLCLKNLKTPRHDMPSRPPNREGKHEASRPKRKKRERLYWSYALRMANISKRKVLVIAGVVACVLRVRLSRCSSSIRLGGRPRRPVEGAIGYRRLHDRARPPFCGMGLRCIFDAPMRKIRRWLVGVAALVAFWMLVVLLKYPIRGDWLPPCCGIATTFP